MTKMKLIRNGFVFWIMFLLLAAMVVITAPTNMCTPSATPTIWVKYDWGPMNLPPAPLVLGTDAFATITGALGVAVTTDHIYVYDGTYNERLTINTNDILLEGESRSDTIIDGGGGGHVIQITADDVNIDKFTVQNSGGSGAGIFLRGVPSPTNYVNGCTITNINCEDNRDGIRLYYAGEDSSNYNTFQYIYCNIEDRYNDDNSIWLEKEANYNQFSDCYIFQSQDLGDDGAIRIYESTYNTFVNIEIYGNDGDGFYLEFDSDGNVIYTSVIQGTENGISLHGSGTNECNDNTIEECDIDSNENSCIYLDNCDANIIDTNNLGASEDSATYSVQLYSSSNIIIINNAIKAANVGIILESDSDSNIIYHNEISNCDSYCVEILSSHSNEIHHNNFIENNGCGESWEVDHIQAYDDFEPPPYDDENSWDNGYTEPFDIDTEGGNYWSDWCHEEMDNFNGPWQDLQGMDGIIDCGYDVEGVNADFYPLKEPVDCPLKEPAT